MPPRLPQALQPLIEMHLGAPVDSAFRLSGGEISDVLRVGTERGTFVLKASRRGLPGLFLAEAAGLALLRSAGTLSVPEVVAHGDGPGGWAYLLLEFLPPAPPTPESEEALGRGLAALHRVTAPQFGDGADNYFGSLPQVNPAARTAADFFWSARLEPQLQRARPQLSGDDLEKFETLRGRLSALIPPEPPALVHGDLWHGNVLYTERGPALIDPAVASSHREVDLALLHLFGEVPARVLAAYQEAHPLAPGWPERAALWNLYPLLAHLNMFGAGYLRRVRAALHQAVNI